VVRREQFEGVLVATCLGPLRCRAAGTVVLAQVRVSARRQQLPNRLDVSPARRAAQRQPFFTGTAFRIRVGSGGQ
jgi:hypothetical protein